jgi:pimeloyl-ACP methyl ester carboxylesterase
VTSLHESFRGAAGNRLAADVFGDAGAPVLLLHGGGQTRHAWRRTAVEIARAGRMAYAVDQRGHGDSEWVADGAYRFKDFADDAAALGGELTRRHGEPPVAIGASLGGIASLLAAGDAEGPIFAALVLVDITPRVDLAGVAKVQGFMRAHAREGFASVEEAADAVAAYLPHRPRPRSTEGL